MEKLYKITDGAFHGFFATIIKHGSNDKMKKVKVETLAGNHVFWIESEKLEFHMAG